MKSRFTMRYGANGLPKKKQEEPSLMNLPPSLMQHDRTPAAAPSDFYAEEASMYTITEDSREARSEVTSLAGTSLGGTERGDALSVNTPLSPVSDPLSISPQGQRPVLTNWNHVHQSQWAQETFDAYEVVDDEVDEEERYRKATVLTYAPQRTTSYMSSSAAAAHHIPALDEEIESTPSHSSEDDQSYLFERHGDRSIPMPMEGDGFLHERKRRRFCGSALTTTSLLVCVILAGVLIAITVPLTQRNSDGSRSQVTGLAANNNNNNDPTPDTGGDVVVTSSPTPVPTVSPTEAPTASPSVSPSSKPSSSPSQGPSSQPSPSPSAAPTKSFSPTPQPTIPGLIAGNPNLVHVYEGLATCPYNNMAETVDYTKPQYSAMWSLAVRNQYSSTPMTADELQERWALIILYTENDGNDWTDLTIKWLSTENGVEAPTCTWSGITCNVNDEVTEINLAGKGVTGEIPAELCCIPTLEAVDLSGNDGITGDIPPCLVSRLTV